MKKASAKQRMLKALSNQKSFTVKEGRKQFHVKNIAARIEELRKEGNIIYTDTRKAKSGKVEKFYRIGTPSKELVKAAIAGGFSFRV